MIGRLKNHLAIDDTPLWNLETQDKEEFAVNDRLVRLSSAKAAGQIGKQDNRAELLPSIPSDTVFCLSRRLYDGHLSLCRQ